MKLFGPSKKEIWRKLSEEIGANFVEGKFLRGDKVQAIHDDWIVTLDTYVVSTGKTAIPFTRMRAPYVNPTGFRFTVYRQGFFSGIAKLLGMQDIQTGAPEFDAEFIVKGTDESKVRQLLDGRIRQLLSAQSKVNLTVKDDEGWFGAAFPQGVDELHFSVPGILKDMAQLKSLYDLFAETLDRLCEIGAADKQASGVKI